MYIFTKLAEKYVPLPGMEDIMWVGGDGAFGFFKKQYPDNVIAKY